MKRIFGAIAAFLILPFIFTVTSCQTIGNFIQEPKVSVSSVDLDKISFSGADMICHLDVQNPNGFDIPFPQVDWELFINSGSFISGTLTNSSKLAANKTVTVDVPFSVTYAGLYKSFSSLMDSTEASYRIALALKFPTVLLSDKTFNLDFSGTIPLLQIPKISGAAFSTGKIDLTGVEQDWTFTVDNPNVFPIPMPKLDWDYGINQVSVLKGGVDSNGMVPALSQSPVTVKVSLAFADLITALGTLGDSTGLQSVMNLDSVFPVPALQDMDFNMEIPSILPVFRKPELKFLGINIKNMALQKLDFVINWEADNPNDFPLDIGNFNYDLKVNNSQWAQGTLDSAPQLKANSKTIIPLNITISSINLINQIIDIINRGSNVNFSSSGSFDFSGDVPGLDKIDLPFDLSGATRLVRL